MEERGPGRGGRDQPGAALDLVCCRRLVDRHLHVDLARGTGRLGEAGLVLFPARPLAGVARALEVEAHDGDPGEHPAETRRQDARGLEEDGQRGPRAASQAARKSAWASGSPPVTAIA